MMLHEVDTKTTVIVIFSWLCLQTTTAAAVSDSLKPGEMLDHSSRLCSAKHRFCLKFQALVSDPSNTYLVIQNTGTSAGYVDWIANRNDPIANDSGVLTLNNSGALIITRQGKKPITLYSPALDTNKSVAATLLDSGNLILQEYDASGSMKRVMWQSFDHPSDVLLPGMKLGVNHKTGQSWSIVASVSSGNPASASVALEWEPKKGQLVTKRRGKIYWTSGLRRNNGLFENIPKKVQLMYTYQIVSNEDEESFSYQSQNDQSQWVLFDNGELKDTRNGDIAQAQNCDGYNTEGGCQIWEDQPMCRHRGDRFVVQFGYFDHPSSRDNYSYAETDKNSTLTASDCKATCWGNCSCVGFTTNFDNGTGCIYYYGDWVPTIVNSAGSSVNILVQTHRNYKDMKKWIKTGVAIGIAIIIISLCIFCLRLRRRKAALQEEKRSKMENDMLDFVASDKCNNFIELQNQVKEGNNLRIFSYASIMAATNRFSLENKLGEGGFGPVYKVVA